MLYRKLYDAKRFFLARFEDHWMAKEERQRENEVGKKKTLEKWPELYYCYIVM